MDDKKYTRFEKTRIIATRALQIAQSSPVLVKVAEDVRDPVDIAKKEWDACVIPIRIKEKKD